MHDIRGATRSQPRPRRGKERVGHDGDESERPDDVGRPLERGEGPVTSVSDAGVTSRRDSALDQLSAWVPNGGPGTAYRRVLDALSQNGNAPRAATEWRARARCPAHDDNKPSLSVTRIEDSVLLHCHAGCDPQDVVGALGMEMRDLFDNRRDTKYSYDDGRIVHRRADKTFWQSGNTAATTTLYHSHRLRPAVENEQTIYVVEGEKDVHAIEAIGGVATCAPMGAGNWPKVDPTPLYGGRIVIVADDDDPGRKHARDVYASLDSMCPNVRVVTAQQGKDAADHIAADHGLDDFKPLDPLDTNDLVAGSPDEQERNLLGRVLRRSQLTSIPPRTPLVEGLLDYPSATVLVGSYGSGKTFLALSLACCVATGRRWLGRNVQRRKVLLVVGEGGSGLDNRIAAWEQGFNDGVPVSDDDLIIDVQPRSLTHGHVWRRIAEQCLSHDIGFVILDTFSSLAPDADETKDAAVTLRNMHDIATVTNGTVLLVHHPGWSDNARTRGGYQFEGNADTVLVLTGTPEDPLVQLRLKKVKDREGGQVIWIRRTPVSLTGDYGGRNSVVIEAVDPAEAGVPFMERIRLVLDVSGDNGVTGRQIMAELGVGDRQRSTFYRHLNKAVEQGMASRQGSGNHQRYFAVRAG